MLESDWILQKETVHFDSMKKKTNACKSFQWIKMRQWNWNFHPHFRNSTALTWKIVFTSKTCTSVAFISSKRIIEWQKFNCFIILNRFCIKNRTVIGTKICNINLLFHLQCVYACTYFRSCLFDKKKPPLGGTDRKVCNHK